MGFIDDPENSANFPADPDDYESIGFGALDTEGRYIIEIFENANREIESEYVQGLLEDLIVNGGLREFIQQLEVNIDIYSPVGDFSADALRMNPFFSATDARAYLEGIPGYEGFAGITWINGVWHVWIEKSST